MVISHIFQQQQFVHGAVGGHSHFIVTPNCFYTPQQTINNHQHLLVIVGGRVVVGVVAIVVAVVAVVAVVTVVAIIAIIAVVAVVAVVAVFVAVVDVCLFVCLFACLLCLFL